MKKQSGYIYHNAQRRDAARAAVEAESPNLSTQEKSQAVMKKLADMWNALDDAAKQKYAADAPLVEVKERKKPAAAAKGLEASASCYPRRAAVLRPAPLELAAADGRCARAARRPAAVAGPSFWAAVAAAFH